MWFLPAAVDVRLWCKLHVRCGAWLLLVGQLKGQVLHIPLAWTLSSTHPGWGDMHGPPSTRGQLV